MNQSCNCPAETATQPAALRPRFQTTENETGATLHIALPGVRKDDLKLNLLESNLKIEATRTAAAGAVPERYALNLRLGNRFDGSKAAATLESGVLTLTVPFREEAKPRQIEVN